MNHKSHTKIALVTWFGGPNLGNNLQVYSLIRVFEGMGLDATLLRLCINPAKKKSIKNHIYLCLYNLFHPHAYRAVTPKSFTNKERYKRVKKFAQEYIPVHCITSHFDLWNIDKHYDIFITGSDQIWNPYYLNTFYLLDFVKRKTKLSYSSSIGVDSIPETMKQVYIKHLQSFHHISVREQASETLLKDILNRNDIITVADPVLLLKKEQWDDFSEHADERCNHINKTPFIFCYTVGTNKEYSSQIHTIQQKYNIDHLYYVTATENANNDINGIGLEWIGPVEFVWMIKNADLVITDSFHCTCLSILYEKDFVELLRFQIDDLRSQNSRLFNLFDCLDISNRFFSLDENWSCPINYQNTSSKLKEIRERSLQYLIDCIS